MQSFSASRSQSLPNFQSSKGFSGTASVASRSSEREAQTNPNARPTSRAGASAVLKTAGILADVATVRPKGNPFHSAGVVQADLNPNIPFSGFPSLNYLRGR